jgi:hypothetical protein
MEVGENLVGGIQYAVWIGAAVGGAFVGGRFLLRVLREHIGVDTDEPDLRVPVPPNAAIELAYEIRGLKQDIHNDFAALMGRLDGIERRLDALFLRPS